MASFYRIFNFFIAILYNKLTLRQRYIRRLLILLRCAVIIYFYFFKGGLPPNNIFTVFWRWFLVSRFLIFKK